MAKLELQIIKLGIRNKIFQLRNAILYLLGMEILIFLISSIILNKESIWSPIITYSIILAVVTFISSILLTAILQFKQTIGILTLDNNLIEFSNKHERINLRELHILLNADQFEFDAAKKDKKAIKNISNTGNQIKSINLTNQTGFELVLNNESKVKLFELLSEQIILEPQFHSRPLLMESPSKILDIVSFFARGWN